MPSRTVLQNVYQPSLGSTHEGSAALEACTLSVLHLAQPRSFRLGSLCE